MFHRGILFLISCASSYQLQFIQPPSDNYLNLIRIYSMYHNIHVWTQFICFPLGMRIFDTCSCAFIEFRKFVHIRISDERIRFASKLSVDGIQSRFIATSDSNAIELMNSNEHFKQGFVIDMTCDGIETIFGQVQFGFEYV